ncbi:MAG: methionyl-tRNA formyltransferase [marine benthic group bacterium]|jgi:methionyl-tRNA formyltransferase|nr:methionyl-tRNA formyltransferase [Gemmatimonadota bacterium]
MRILFWGTPEFAVPSLRALQEEGHAVLAVVTQPDRPAGRGRQLRESPVKIEAEREGIPVLQPEKPRGEAFHAEIEALEPDLSVVAAYGHILTDEVLALPRLGSVNVHASLLPELRGAAPVNWAIILGHSHSGVTIMRMVRELDAGPILYRVATPLPDDITAGELYLMLSEMGATALIEALAQMEAGVLEESEQEHERATYAPKLARDDARVDWTLDAGELHRWIRGCDPWPAAWSKLGDQPVQIFRPELVEESPEGTSPAAPGTVVRADVRGGVEVATGGGRLRIGEVKPAGKGRMPSAAWVGGRGVKEGDRFD